MPYNELLGEVYKALRERIALASAVESGSAETALEADLASASGLNQAASTSESQLEYDAEAQAAATFVCSLGSWPLFPDTLSALNSLKRLGYALVLLSNVDDASIRQMTLPRLDPETYTMPTRARTGGIPPGGNSRSNSNRSSESLFAGVLTAEQLGAYKPDPRVLSAALEHIETSLGVNSEDVLVVAQSLFHDHVPAKSLGLKTVWVDREGSEMGLGVGEGEEIWDWRFASLEEIVKAVEDERKADGGIVSSGKVEFRVVTYD